MEASLTQVDLVTFRFGLRDAADTEDFLARTSDAAVIAEARRQLDLPIEKRRHINGPIERAAPGQNLRWHWRHRDSAWSFAQISIELCDGAPSYIEANLEAWLAEVGRFCPWHSYVKVEEQSLGDRGAMSSLAAPGIDAAGPVKRFEKIKQMLDALVGGQEIGAHGAFWRGATLEEFKAQTVFGYPLLVVGKSAESNLIRALSGEAPFGSDIGTGGAFFRRMPAGRGAASAAQVQYIARWIDAGCPDDAEAGIHASANPVNFDPTHHNAYWRDFDNWAMFKSPPDVRAAIGAFFPVAPKWFSYAKGPGSEYEWATAIASPQVQSALKLLSQRQKETVAQYYGDPIDMIALLDSYKRFGAGTLPHDPLRPQDPEHKMNGREMWFFWAAFSDACLRSGIDVDFWKQEMRAIFAGLMHDGLFRGRFAVRGFSADDAGSAAILEYVRGLADPDLQLELRTRFSDSGVG